MVTAAPAGAAPNPYPATPLDLWGQSGTAYAVEVVGNTAYIGGAFTAGPPLHAVASLG